MTTVLFESHSTSLDNEAGLASGHFDVELSPTGLQQARELGERHLGSDIAAVFSSALQRSYRTAELAFEGRAIAIFRDRRLRECDYGEFTRRPRQEVLSQIAARVDAPFPGGESYREAAGRVKEFLKEASARFPQKVILIIGHRATQFALEHWLKRHRLEEIVVARWHWKPGWRYRLDPSAEPWA